MKHAKVQLHYLKCRKGDKCLEHSEHAKDGSVIAEYILIENEDDLTEYENLLTNAAGEQIRKCLTSPLFPDKVDHMLGARDMGTQLLAVAHIEASAHQLTHEKPDILNNPLYRIETAAAAKIAAFRRALGRDHHILVGSAGGYMFHMPGRTEILETYDKRPESGAPKPFVRPGNKIIVLENDWTIPSESRAFLDRRSGGWTNWSNIVGLRDYTHEQLVELLRQFKTDGGEEVFVYTTGADVPQMFDYTDALIEAGLTKLILYFVDGATDKHADYFKKFRPVLNIEVLGTLGA